MSIKKRKENRVTSPEWSDIKILKESENQNKKWALSKKQKGNSKESIKGRK